ncbi:TPA: hypothetical protein DDW35_06520 [Candidatus Sumerlaeota bacterium]|nr:hypothetical protein [Candidatus Sumerlaeota bacterium]
MKNLLLVLLACCGFNIAASAQTLDNFSPSTVTFSIIENSYAEQNKIPTSLEYSFLITEKNYETGKETMSRGKRINQGKKEFVVCRMEDLSPDKPPTIYMYGRKLTRQTDYFRYNGKNSSDWIAGTLSGYMLNERHLFGLYDREVAEAAQFNLFPACKLPDASDPYDTLGTPSLWVYKKAFEEQTKKSQTKPYSIQQTKLAAKNVLVVCFPHVFCYLSPEYDYKPVQLDYYSGALSRRMIIEQQRLPGGFVFPKAIQILEYKKDMAWMQAAKDYKEARERAGKNMQDLENMFGFYNRGPKTSLKKETYITILKASINQPVDPKIFDPQFPKGTQVLDNMDTGDAGKSNAKDAHVVGDSDTLLNAELDNSPNPKILEE